MKTKFALITFTAAALLTFAITPVHAGKVKLDNNHQQNAYAIKVTFVGTFGTNDVAVCATANEEHEVQDVLAAVSKILVFKTNQCLNGTPDNLTGTALKEYNVPNTLDIKRTFTVTIGQSGPIQVTEP